MEVPIPTSIPVFLDFYFPLTIHVVIYRFEHHFLNVSQGNN